MGTSIKITGKLNREIAGVPRMMKSNDHEQTWGWDEPAHMEGESRRGVTFERDAWREIHDSAGWWLKKTRSGGGGRPVCWHRLPASPLAAMVVVGWWGGWEADWHALAVG